MVDGSGHVHFAQISKVEVPQKPMYDNKYRLYLGNGISRFGSPSKYNDKYKYLLNVIDIFSRFA